MLKVYPPQQKKIILYLTKRYESPKDLIPLCETIDTLIEESPQYFEAHNLCFLKIIKEIIKAGFKIKNINAKLDKILYLKAKK